MTVMLFLKALSDLGFLYALFSPLLAVFAIPKTVFFAAWILQSLAYALSEKLKDRGLLRFLPFLLCLLPLAGGFGLKTAVFLLPGTAYGVFLARRIAYELDRDQEISVFKRFWLIVVLEAFGMLLAGRWYMVGDRLLPIALVTAAALILLMRALRHDAAVWMRPKYQAADLALMGVFAGIIGFVSSGTVRSSILETIRFLYLRIVVPVLMVVITAIAQLLVWITTPLQKLMQSRGIDFDLELGAESAREIFEIEEGDFDPTAGEAIRYILIACGIAAAVVLIVLLFRRLAPGISRDRGRPRTVVTRSFSRDEKKSPSPAGSEGSAAQVRARYKSFLKLYVKKRLPIRLSSTSRDIEAGSAGHFDGDAAARMRRLYLAARYDGHATAQDAEEAKALLKKLKDSAQ